MVACEPAAKGTVDTKFNISHFLRMYFRVHLTVSDVAPLIDNQAIVKAELALL